jgi:LysM repeat protein
MKKQSLLIAVMITLLAANVVRAAAPDSDGQEYIVQPGDWLSKIAGKFYGDIFAYPSIVKATNAKAAEDDSFDVIDNPDVIEIDQKLWIPAQAPEPGGVTLMDLKNGVYEGIYAEPVQLAAPAGYPVSVPLQELPICPPDG